MSTHLRNKATASKILKAKVEALPSEPGIYIMKDAKYKVIYVGKAKNLKNRVRSYFRNKLDRNKVKKLVSYIEDFEIILTKTENEALLLERNLIKQHQPKYNAVLKDDKSFPLIRIDTNSKWPRVSKVRHRKDDKALYLGPYVNERQIYRLLNTAYKIFPLIRCSDHEFRNAKRPCTYYHMKMCLAPCSLPVETKDYEEVIADTIKFLKGKNTELLDILQKKMQTASDNESYEQAAVFRDQLLALKKNLEKQSVIMYGVQSADAISVFAKDGSTAIHVLSIRDENIVASQSYFWAESFADKKEILTQFLTQYYENHAPPKKVFLPLIDEDFVETIQNYIACNFNINFEVVFPQIGQKNALIDLATKNARYHYEFQIKNSTLAQTTLQITKDELKLDRLPETIECIDISNLQGEAIVASLVCFKGAKPFKANYRLYNIKTVEGTPNDYASIQEVVSRRLQRAVKENDLPDLLVIDGGKQQLDFAYKALAEFPSLDLEIVSLAKSRLLKNADKKSTAKMIYSDERVFKKDSKRPLPLKAGSPSYRLLTQLRDEAHRFALQHHRKKRTKASFTSELDSVKGIGPKLKRELLRRFESIESLKLASLEQLKATPGLPETVALSLYTSFKK